MTETKKEPILIPKITDKNTNIIRFAKREIISYLFKGVYPNIFEIDNGIHYIVLIDKKKDNKSEIESSDNNALYNMIKDNKVSFCQILDGEKLNKKYENLVFYLFKPEQFKGNAIGLKPLDYFKWVYFNYGGENKPLNYFGDDILC